MPAGITSPTAGALYPSWLKPENASVFDPAYKSVLRKIVSVLGLDDPNQVMALGLPLEVGSATGGLVEALAEKLPRLMKVIKAYHGSPHDFEKFDISKIGTGEGAQAYGHGLYFAEKEGTARSYRDALSPMEVNVRGVPGVTWEKLTPGMRGVQKNSLDVARASGKFTPAELDAMAFMSDANLDTTIRSMREQAGMEWRGAEARKLWNQRADILEQLKAETTIKPTGKMYEVAIKADPEHFLDWDAPLSQQPEAVRYVVGYKGRPSEAETEAVFTLARKRGVPPTSMPEYKALEARMDEAAKLERDYPTGRDIYNQWMHDQRDIAIRQGRNVDTTLPASQAAASEDLRKMGIPGIKYLDQGSRAAGEGTRNYVVFDDKTVEILRKYGLLLPAAGLGASQVNKQ